MELAPRFRLLADTTHALAGVAWEGHDPVHACMGIDVGGSEMRLRVESADGHLLVEATGPGLAGEEPEAAAVRFAAAIQASHPQVPMVGSVAIGLTGLHGLRGDALRVLNDLAALFGTTRVAIADDCVTSYVGAVGSGPATVIAAGTGLVTLATDGKSRWARADGWGALLDLGGGAWVGRAGLVAAMRAVDGRSGSPRLLSGLRRLHGDPQTFVRGLSSQPDASRVIAGFAQEVAAAARDNDPVAIDIWREAARLLCETVLTAYGRVGSPQPARVSWVGRLFNAGDLLLEPLRACLESALPGVQLTSPRGNGLDGAVAIAKGQVRQDFGPLLTIASVKD